MATNSSRCYPPMPAVSNGILQGDLPFNFALPLLTLQIAVVLLVTRTMAALFKPIKQPQVLAEIIGGVILGPTALGRISIYMETLFPTKSLPLLETVATIGLMFFIFMVGMNLDLQVLKKIGKNALLIAATGISVPFIVSIGLASLVRSTISKEVKFAPLLIFMGAPISISAFSVLVRIMAELKLLSTDIAKIAIPIAALNDVTIWTLLAVGVAIAGGGNGKGGALTPVYVILCAVGFGIFMFTVARKGMGVVALRATRPGGKESSDLYVCITLMSVLGAGFCSDAVGVHALLGPFLLGLVLPKDNPFPKMITEKIEDFVTGLFLPLFFASSGLKTNLGTLHGINSLGFLVLFFCTAAIGKIVATFVAARLIGLPNRRALILGFLLNTKGLAVLIVLNIGRDLKALTDELFAILVLTALLTSFVTTPAVTALCKPGIGGELLKVVEQGSDGRSKSMHSTFKSTYSRRKANNPHCTLASLLLHNPSNGSSSKKANHPQLRILACAYEPHNHSSFINLLEATRGVKLSPLKLYPLKLSLLSDRPSALFMLTPSPLDAPTLTSTTTIGPLSPLSFPPSPSLSKVTVRPLSSVSSIDSMHDDICKIAAQKRTALILLPYHKPSTHNITMFGDPSFKVTQKVLDHAPCSVGILVDRGSMGISPIHPAFFSYKVVVLFVGGPDDREALFTGSRMIGHPGVALKLVRFISSSNINHFSNNLQANNNNLYSFEEVDDEQEEAPTPPASENLKADFEGAKESVLDDEAIAMVKQRAAESSFVYEEALVASGQSLVEAVKAFTKGMNEVNMFIVGRGRLRPKLSNTTSLCHQDQQNTNNLHHQQGEQLSELGVLGDVLASSSSIEFHACIMVVQQHLSDYAAHKETTCKTVAKMPSIPRPQSPSFEISVAP